MDIDKQSKIANILFDIDTQLERNNNIIKRLQVLAQTTYSRWFNQFEFPNDEGKPYKSNDGELIYNKELGKEIPKDWEVKSIKDITNCLLGGTPSRDDNGYWNGTINWINSGEVSSFPILKTEEKISQKGLDNSATKLLPIGSVVVSITGNIRFSILGIDSCANQSVVGILENNNFKKSFLYFALKNYEYIYISKMTGAVQKHINKEVIETSKVLVPTEDVLNAYYYINEPNINRIIEISKNTEKLIALKEKLLPLLINGQLNI
jgi:type I restriction enzyme S subunit